MTDPSVHLFGPADGPTVLAVHGMTGHGRRWRSWSEHLPAARVIAPDLIGHGRAPYTPPWSIEAQVARLADVLRTHAEGPAVVVGHSYGCALALHLARTEPAAVAGLVLLDPAAELPPERLLEVAESTVRHDDYTDAEEARSDKVHGAWNDVPTDLLDEELADHLIDAEGGRVRWRTSTAAVVSSWGELARPMAVPPPTIPTVVVRASRVQPPYLSDECRERLAADLDHVTFVDLDCDHMVPQAKGPESAAVVADLLTTVSGVHRRD